MKAAAVNCVMLNNYDCFLMCLIILVYLTFYAALISGTIVIEELKEGFSIFI